MKKILFSLLFVLLAVIGTASAATWISTPGPQIWVHDNTKEVDLYSDLTGIVGGEVLGLIDTTGHFMGTGTCSFTECKITITPLAKWASFEDVKFWISSVTNLAPAITRLTVTNTAPLATAYTLSPLAPSEDNMVDVTLVANDPDGDNMVYSIVTQPTHGTLSVIDQINHKLTYTPTLNYNGLDSFTFKVNDGIVDSNTLIVPITITAVDDPLTKLTIPDQKWTKGEGPYSIDLKNYFSDPDDTITYTSEPTTLTNFDISPIVINGVITFTPKSSTWKGTEKINFTATTTKASLTSNEVKLTVREKPDFICTDGELGDLEIYSVSDPSDGDNFKPGDEIPIKLKVRNNNVDDSLDVVVGAYLYDETDDKIIENVESESINIAEDGEYETFEFKLLIPSDEDLDESHTYQLFLKAYEDGNEDENCIENTAIGVDLQRDSNDVIISGLSTLPSIVNPGETVDFTITTDNIGTSKQKEVTVKLTSTELGLSWTSETFDLDKFSGSNYDRITRYSFIVPSNIKAGTYQIDVGVYNSNGNLYSKSDNSERFITLTVGGTTPITAAITTTTTGATTATTTTTGTTAATSKWTDVFGSFEGSKLFWIIGDIILVIVAIFFIKLIFSGRRKPVKEARL